MVRKTNYMMYVDKAVMGDPATLFDATFSRFIKKGMDHAKRKKFMFEFMRAGDDVAKLKVINEWIQVRDATTFPFAQVDTTVKEVESEDTPVAGRVPVDRLGNEGDGEARDGSDPSDGHDDAGDAGGGDTAGDEDAV